VGKDKKLSDVGCVAYALCFLEIANGQLPDKKWVGKGFKILNEIVKEMEIKDLYKIYLKKMEIIFSSPGEHEVKMEEVNDWYVNSIKEYGFSKEEIISAKLI